MNSVRTQIIHAQHPFVSELTLHAKGPLFGIRIQQRVGITLENGSWEELIIECSLSGPNIDAAYRRDRACGERRQWNSSDAGGESNLPRRSREVKYSCRSA